MKILDIIRTAYEKITKRSDIPSLVLKEAENLRKFARKHELENLNLRFLNPNSANDCVYGQMTGSCYSKRAEELIQKCCERVYNPGENGGSLECATLNGSPKGKERLQYWSPIEVFIFKSRYNKKVLAKLIKIIKGE